MKQSETGPPVSKRKKKPMRNTHASKLMAQRARWMRNGAATFHEQVAGHVVGDVCKQNNFTLKNQKIFYDEKKNKWYIVDFFIPEIRLIIEVDGSSHDNRKAYDAIRTKFLESIGNKVVRFLNKELEDLQFRGKVARQICIRVNDPTPVFKPETQNPNAPPTEITEKQITKRLRKQRNKKRSKARKKRKRELKSVEASPKTILRKKQS